MKNNLILLKWNEENCEVAEDRDGSLKNSKYLKGTS